MELNVRIQKSLILDFNERSARESAEQDWRIDLERESKPEENETDPAEEEDSDVDSDSDEEVVQRAKDAKAQAKIDKFEAKSAKGIEYERLSEFFFDLCLSWCQFLDIETFLFFINGVFLNITRGQHVNVS